MASGWRGARAIGSVVLALVVACGAAAVGLPRLAFADAAAPRQSAQALIDAVNDLRATYGLGPLNGDPILMLVAQRQNDYSISIGQITHYGPDGSRPREQAIAAGYGGGRTVFISENIAMGTGLSPQDAVQWWTGDEPHLNTMIGPYYRDVGAAAGESGGFAYYTLVTGYVAGGISAQSTAPVAVSAPVFGGPLPVVTSTPQPDGSVIHILENGQALWTVAAIYGVSLDELLRLNGLSADSVVHPGDAILVRAAPTATPSPVPTSTETPPPATRSPEEIASTATAVAIDAAGPLARITLRDVLSWVVVGAWVVLIIAGVVFAIRRP